MRKTFQYRAKINKQTEVNCLQWLETCRILYNLALDQRINAYRQDKKSISVYVQMSQLPDLKKEFPEFKIVGSQALQDVLQRLDRAFKAFFQRVKNKSEKAGFPRFRGRDRYDSFTLKQAGWKIIGRYLYITGIGRFKLFLSRPIEGDIKTITIRHTSSGKWFVSFSCDNVQTKELPESDTEVGIDVGIKSFLVDSLGNSVGNPQFFRQSERILRRRQRRLARRKRGSNRRRKARILVAKAHEKIANQRKDFLHKVANSYIASFGAIYVEKLNIQGMIRNRHLSKSIADSGWGMFIEMLSWKAVEAARKVIKVNPRNTSQICSRCGEKVPKKLSVRIHACPFCGLVLDRDHNAAKNIAARGHRVQTITDRLLSVV